MAVFLRLETLSRMFSLARIASFKGSLTRIYYSKLYSVAHLLSYDFFFVFALKGSKHFFFFILSL